MDKHIEIHETAFVTATFRSLYEYLSHDVYAKLWYDKNTEKWIYKYLKEVSYEEAFAHCLRNRYFLDTIKDLTEKNKIEMVINFGSGFSMYPFLLDEKLVHIEIDKPQIITYKKSKVDQWQQTGVLPKRNIYFIGIDFTTEYRQELRTKIEQIKKGKPCFILIEGVLFFLTKQEIDQLFNFFEMIQNAEDFLGSASFQPSLKATMAFKKLIYFLNKGLTAIDSQEYQTIDDIFYKNLKEYQLIDHQDYFSLSKMYNHTTTLEKDLILNENFYVLKKLC